MAMACVIIYCLSINYVSIVDHYYQLVKGEMEITAT